MTDKHVIIVGAGHVGLTAAMLLVERGVRVTVLEAESAVSDDLRASTFHPPTLDMLAPYGLTTKLIDAGLICPTWQIRMHATGEKAEFDLGLISDLTAHPYRLQCEQAVLCRLISDHLTNDSLVELRFNARVVGLEQDHAGVALKVECAETPSVELLRAAYVIGADGASSAVRQLIGCEFEGFTYPETTVLASTPFAFLDTLRL